MLDEVGEALDDLPDIIRVQKLLFVRLEVQGHVRAAAVLAHRLDGEIALAVRLPAHALVGRVAGQPRNYRHLVRDHEGGVEADAELADQLRPLLRLEARQKRARARPGDGAEVLDGQVARHAEAVVGHRERVFLLVEGDLDLPVLVAFQLVLVLERIELELVDGVAGVGDQLAQEDFLVGIKRMGDDVQELFQLRFELQFLRVRCGLCHEAVLRRVRVSWNYKDGSEERRPARSASKGSPSLAGAAGWSVNAGFGSGRGNRSSAGRRGGRGRLRCARPACRPPSSGRGVHSPGCGRLPAAA